MTGFWKTDRIVTLGLFHFIGPANGYTCTHIHSAITRLGWLVCFSRASFTNPVNSWIRQWDPWRVLHGRHGSEIHPSDSEASFRPSKHVWAYGWHFLDSQLVQIVLMEPGQGMHVHLSYHQLASLYQYQLSKTHMMQWWIRSSVLHKDYKLPIVVLV